LGGEPPRGSSYGGLLGGKSPNRNQLKGPPLDPPIRLYKWTTPHPRIFMPPWYQPVAVQFKPTNKLPY